MDEQAVLRGQLGTPQFGHKEQSQHEQDLAIQTELRLLLNKNKGSGWGVLGREFSQ
jgi:hypothetical protein